MRRAALSHRLAALAALSLVLSVAGCNSAGEKANRAEAVIEVTAVVTAGTSLAAPEDVTAAMTLSVMDRTSGQATTFFNDVTFTNYTVVYTPTGMVPDVSAGALSTGFCPIGSSSCALLLTMVPSGSKPAIVGTVSGAVHVEGHDVVGKAVSFDATVVVTFIP